MMTRRGSNVRALHFFFLSRVPLTSIINLFVVGDTDLLAVYPTELAESSSVPRLGDLNGPRPMTSKRAIELRPEVEPGQCPLLAFFSTAETVC